MMYSNIGLSFCETVPLKGLLHKIFEVCFCHQTTPPGHIRDILEPFSFLMIFHVVIQVLKWLLGVRNTGSCNINNEVSQKTTPQRPGNRRFLAPRHCVFPVFRTPGIRFFILFFKLQANLPPSGTPGANSCCPGHRGVENLRSSGPRGQILLVHVYKNFLWLPVFGTPGSRL